MTAAARLLLTLTAALICAAVSAATQVTVAVTDKATGAPAEFAAVAWNNAPGTAAGGLTDSKGTYTADLAAGRWVLSVSSVGYLTHRDTVTVSSSPLTIAVTLTEAYTQIGEVVVTAREGRGITSASLIDRTAMEHLQPSSFTDLMEMLPGAVSKDPEMGKANLAGLRQAQNASTDGYEVASLGTSFVIDGVPLNTSSDLQSTADASRAGRLTAGKGVDMRSLSTDDIESVEVVRGIASAEYGEVSSGLIEIKRKAGATPLQARFKADAQSQLFYVGKGIRMPSPDWTLNFGADYLDSKIDPRNNRENFKRVTASARSAKKWTGSSIITTWSSSLNYTGTFERDKNDPDLTVNNTVDYYTSDNHRVSWDNTLAIVAPLQPFFHSLTFTTGISYADEKLHQEKTVASSRLYPMPVSLTPGTHIVGYLPMVYLADLDVLGKPFTAFVKGAARFRYALPFASNTLKAGAEWNVNKNFGRGQVYDLMRPITAGNTQRPRPFSDIPAMHQLSAYVEHESDIHAGSHAVQLQLGLRETQLLHLDSRYHISGRPYLDPRVNVKWTLPSTFAAGWPIGWELAGGIGQHTKMPVAAHLFPDPLYTDFTQLNYFHDVEQYRTMVVRTYVEDLTNYDLRPMRNLKWEVRGDVTYRNNRLSVTYFRERANDAFRQTGSVHYYSFLRYDASGFNPSETGRPPVISELPSETDSRLAVVSSATNRSRIDKEGVEFTFSSMRIPVVRTRVTVSGAWLKTTFTNSGPLWYKPSSVVNGKELQLAGLYDDPEGSVYESFNTNFTFDTDVPRLGLNFSVAVQNMWYTSRQVFRKSGIPLSYTDTDGQLIVWDSAMAADPYLGQLVRHYSPSAFDRQTVPVATTFNIKATKKLWHDRIGIAIYVNRLLSITPDYYRYGSLQRRYTSPYFGMELNLSL